MSFYPFSGPQTISGNLAVNGIVSSFTDSTGFVTSVSGIQLGNTSVLGGTLVGGSGAPNIPGAPAGSYYLRIDTPAVANQRLYVATAVNTWAGII